MTTAKPIKTPTGRSKPTAASNRMRLLGGGTVLLIGAGVGWWYLRKRKKVRNTWSQSAERHLTPAPGGFRCVSSTYPLEMGTCHPDVGILQRYLKSFNTDLGTSGKNRDGVDHQFGARTRAAARQQLGKEAFQEADIEGMKRALTFVGS